MRRYLSIWLPQLVTDRVVQLRPELKDVPFVLAAPVRGRAIVQAASRTAIEKGITPGMVVADARVIMPHLNVYKDRPGLAEKLLTELAEWCLRFTPVAAVDLPDGLLLETTGCAHLWGGEMAYLKDIIAEA